MQPGLESDGYRLPAHHLTEELAAKRTLRRGRLACSQAWSQMAIGSRLTGLQRERAGKLTCRNLSYGNQWRLANNSRLSIIHSRQMRNEASGNIIREEKQIWWKGWLSVSGDKRRSTPPMMNGVAEDSAGQLPGTASLYSNTGTQLGANTQADRESVGVTARRWRNYTYTYATMHW